MKRPVQYFSDEYLEYCKKMKPTEIIEFLENFRELNANLENSDSKSKLISIKVPENLLNTFKQMAKKEGMPYQTLMKKLMREWILSKRSSS